jgi:hypothetical protein
MLIGESPDQTAEEGHKKRRAHTFAAHVTDHQPNPFTSRQTKGIVEISGDLPRSLETAAISQPGSSGSAPGRKPAWICRAITRSVRSLAGRIRLPLHAIEDYAMVSIYLAGRLPAFASLSIQAIGLISTWFNAPVVIRGQQILRLAFSGRLFDTRRMRGMIGSRFNCLPRSKQYQG